LFSELPPKPRQPSPKAAKPQVPPTDDLFVEAPTKPKTTPTKPKTTPTKDDLFTSDTQLPRTETKPRAEPDIFDNPPENILPLLRKATKVAKVNKDGMFVSSTDDIFSRGGRKSKGLDDLFATEVPKANLL